MITSPQQATPEWLTYTLQNAGILRQGQVKSIGFRANDAFNSVVTHLEVEYSADANADLPKKLILKLNRDHNGETEVKFYNLVKPLSAQLPMLVNCYLADYDPSTGDTVCLLQDISATHHRPAKLPPDDQLNSIIEALAGFHAYWWQHPELGQHPDLTEVRWWYRDAGFFERHIERRQNEWAKFIGGVGQDFPKELQSLYENALSNLPHLWGTYLAPRIAALQNITLSHGDCYLNQFLCPIESGQTHIVDFDSVSANFGPYDLVYLMTTVWTPEQRHKANREMQVLHLYHEILQAKGISGYSWENLLTDYRLMISLMIFDPVFDQTNGSRESYWWPKMQCLTGAYQDLYCAALLK